MGKSGSIVTKELYFNSELCDLQLLDLNLELVRSHGMSVNKPGVGSWDGDGVREEFRQPVHPIVSAISIFRITQRAHGTVTGNSLFVSTFVDLDRLGKLINVIKITESKA